MESCAQDDLEKGKIALFVAQIEVLTEGEEALSAATGSLRPSPAGERPTASVYYFASSRDAINATFKGDRSALPRKTLEKLEVKTVDECLVLVQNGSRDLIVEALVQAYIDKKSPAKIFRV